MYWAVLNQIRIEGFLRTNVSTENAVTPLTSIGHGCSNSIIDVINGMNATELLMFANEIRRNEVSQRMASAANATSAFQVAWEPVPGRIQVFATRKQPAATVTAATSK